MVEEMREGRKEHLGYRAVCTVCDWASKRLFFYSDAMGMAWDHEGANTLPKIMRHEPDVTTHPTKVVDLGAR